MSSPLPDDAPAKRRRPARGQYRIIHRALYLLPEWSRLTPRARLVLLVLKTLTGPTGIERKGPAALAEELSEATAFAPDDVLGALDELEGAGWIQRDRQTVWIVAQLAWEEGMHPASWQQRTSVQRHLQDIPAGPVLQAWRARYPEWLISPSIREHTLSDTLSDTLSERVCDTPMTDDRQPTTDHPHGGGRSGLSRDAVTTPQPDIAPPTSESVAWTAAACEVLRRAGRPASLSPDIEPHAAALRAAGVASDALARGAQAMLEAPGLDRAGLSMLLKQWERWRAAVAVGSAAERWALYNREGFTDVMGDIAAPIAACVARGVWPSADAALEELSHVRPWDVARTARDREDAIRKVAARLSEIPRAA